jgi:hypothetical protein
MISDVLAWTKRGLTSLVAGLYSRGISKTYSGGVGIRGRLVLEGYAEDVEMQC